MAEQIIDIGDAINDGTGDPARIAYDKSNQNFTELYKGAGGTSEGLWNFNQTSTDTSTTPVSGRFKTNSGNYRDATQIAIHGTTIQDVIRADTLRKLLTGDIVQCQDSTNSAAWCRYILQSAPIDHGGWFQLDVALETDGGVASGDNQEIVFVFTASKTGGGGNVSNSGTPTAGQYGKWVTATTIEGVAPATVLSDIGAQAAGSCQPLDATLTALAAYNTNGLLTQTAADAFTGRTLTGPAAGITVSNGNGVLGNPTIALANDLAALEALTGTNTIYYRSASDTWSAVTVSTGLTFTGGNLAATAPDLSAYAPLAGPTFTGDPKAPTPTAGDNDTSIATTAFVTAAVAAGGGAAAPGPPQGRLTLQTLTPVMVTTQSAKTAIFYTPYVGNQIPLYNGTSMVMTAFAELTVATTDTTKNPAAIGASKVNDWFIWTDAGTIRISHGPDWTNDTTRSAGTALVLVNGILLNNASITNGPAASRGTYVGTTRSNASSQLDWIFGGLGTAGFFGVWNCYNRERVGSRSGESADTWSYTTAAWRQINGAATTRASFVVGQNWSVFEASYSASLLVDTTPAVAAIGVGFDSVTAFTGVTGTGYAATSASCMFASIGRATAYPGIGFHFVQAIEYGCTNCTYKGDNGNPTFQQGGLVFGFDM